MTDVIKYAAVPFAELSDLSNLRSPNYQGRKSELCEFGIEKGPKLLNLGGKHLLCNQTMYETISEEVNISVRTH